MHGFNQKVSGLLQMLREGEREKVLASLDPSIAEKIKERRQKERRAPGEGGIDAERSGAEAKARHTGVPDYDPATSLIESAGKYHTQRNPEEGNV